MVKSDWRLISVRPQWCEKIAAREKTLEIRKNKPKIPTPFTCYIYETKGATNTPWMDEDGHIDFHGRGQVIGEFVCDKISPVAITGMFDYTRAQIDNGGQLLLKSACLTSLQFIDYLGIKNGYGWHISALQIYDKPRELSEFGISRAPQSWCYVEAHDEA